MSPGRRRTGESRSGSNNGIDVCPMSCQPPATSADKCPSVRRQSQRYPPARSDAAQRDVAYAVPKGVRPDTGSPAGIPKTRPHNQQRRAAQRPVFRLAHCVQPPRQDRVPLCPHTPPGSQSCGIPAPALRSPPTSAVNVQWHPVPAYADYAAPR